MDKDCISGAALIATKNYKLKPLPKDTPPETIIEFINLLDVQIWPENSENAQHFIDDHPDLVEEITQTL